jgi:RimJ/RimL family protein N-acetyltransferase
LYYGDLVKLRALELTDLDIILKYWNNLEIRRFLGSTLPNSYEAEKAWLERATKLDPWRDGELVLAIEDKQTGEFIGTTSLFDISRQHRHAEFGIALHNPANLSKGYGTDTARVMLWVGFHVIGLNNIYLYALAHNARAIRCYEKAGFKHVGVFKEIMYVLGKFEDATAMEVLRSEFMELYPPGVQVGTK